MVYWIRCSLINWALLLSEQIEWGSVICCGDTFYDFWPLTLIQAVLQRHTLYSNAKCGVCLLLISLCHSWQWFLHKKKKKKIWHCDSLWISISGLGPCGCFHAGSWLLYFMETVAWAGSYFYVLLSSTDFCCLRKWSELKYLLGISGHAVFTFPLLRQIKHFLLPGWSNYSSHNSRNETQWDQYMFLVWNGVFVALI